MNVNVLPQPEISGSLRCILSLSMHRIMTLMLHPHLGVLFYGFLEKSETGLRDTVLLSLMYATGARVQEI